MPAQTTDTSERQLTAADNNVQRFGSIIGVKPDKLDDYRELHTDPWPEINQALKAANIRNYSIYLTQLDDGNWMLFSHFEYTGHDFEADMKAMAEMDCVKRWWKETAPCQTPLDSRREGDWWKALEEAYRLD